MRLGSLGAGLTALLLVAASACGRSTSSDGGTQVVAGAAASLSSVGSARVSMAISGATQPAGASTSSPMEGVYDFRAGAGEMHPAGSRPGAPQSFIVVNGNAYSRLGPPFDEMLPGKQWLVRPLPTRSEPDRGLGALAGPFGGIDPGSIVSGLAPYVTRTTKLGRDRVRDVAVTQYEVVVDVKRTQGNRGSPSPSASGQLGATHPVHIWVDDDGRVRRISVPLVIPANPTNQQEAVFTYTVEYWDFGLPVTVVPPPSDEVATFEQWRTAPCQGADSRPGGGGCATSRSTFELKPGP